VVLMGVVLTGEGFPGGAARRPFRPGTVDNQGDCTPARRAFLSVPMDGWGWPVPARPRRDGRA
jgi:hypothetical protein